MNKSRIYTLLGLALSLLCLAWFLRQVDFARLGEMARALRPLPVLACLALVVLGIWFRSLRWRALLASVGEYRLGALFSANLVGLMANNLLPARLGEVARAYAAKRLAGTPVAGALGSIVVERVLDGLALCLVLFITLWFVAPEARAGAFDLAYLRGAGLGLLGLFSGVLALVVGLLRWPRRVTALVVGLAGRLSRTLARRLEGWLVSFGQGLAVLGQGRCLPGLVLYTVLVWFCAWGASLVFLPAVGLAPRPLWGALALVGGCLAGLVPAAPGYLGTMQLALYWALTLGDAPAEPSLAYAVMFWAVSYLTLTAAGLVELWRRGLKFSRLRREEPGPPPA